MGLVAAVMLVGGVVILSNDVSVSRFQNTATLASVLAAAVLLAHEVRSGGRPDQRMAVLVLGCANLLALRDAGLEAGLGDAGWFESLYLAAPAMTLATTPMLGAADWSRRRA